MSTNYTQNYNLCQWEASDKVLRADFNADNAKLEAALTAQQTAINRAQSTANNAYSPNYRPVITGYYTGDGAASQSVNLGFQPTAVLVIESTFLATQADGYSDRMFSGVAILGVTPEDAKKCVEITGNGFQVFNGESNGNSRNTNLKNRKYIYFAFR